MKKKDNKIIDNYNIKNNNSLISGKSKNLFINNNLIISKIKPKLKLPKQMHILAEIIIKI